MTLNKETFTHLFDDDITHHGWQLWTRRAIIMLIIVSGVLSFVETFADFAMRWQHILFVVDCVIVGIFSIEVALRIWVGGKRYVTSFYGVVDIISTYPFYLAFIFPIPYTMLRVLRVVRLLRVFRYMRATHILSKAIKSKRDELWVSLQFLFIITFVLSIMLYHVEHTAQPEIYEDGFTSVAWAFAQYIGDPGGFADYSPVTFLGKVIACVIGILGIAIFAVPAGIIGSAFVDVMDEERKNDENKENVGKLNALFKHRQCRDTLTRYCPQFVSMATIQARAQLSESDIFDAVNSADDMRFVNLGDTYSQGKVMPALLAIEKFPINTEYGCYVDRGSNITIVSTSGTQEPGIGWFAWYLAWVGGFNYVSKEIETRPNDWISYFIVDPDRAKREDNLNHFIDDISALADRSGGKHLVLTLLSSSFGDEPDYPTQFHFQIGSTSKGDSTYNDRENHTISDYETFDAMYRDMCEMLRNVDLGADLHQYHKSGPKNYVRLIDGCERVVVRIATDVIIRHPHRMLIIHRMADILRRHYWADADPIDDKRLKNNTGFGYEL